MKKLLTAIAVAVLAIGCITAQTPERIIRGYVLDKETGAPIIGAEVSAVGSGETTITESDGSFTLSIPPFLKYVSATYTGMGSKKKKVNFNSDMIFEMKPKYRYWFIGAVGCFSLGSNIDDPSVYGGGGGLMGGLLSTWGYYAKATIDSQICPVITAGVVKSFTKSVYGFLGVGYGMVYGMSENWPYENGLDNGMAFDIGCIFKVSRHINILVADTYAHNYNCRFRNTVNVGVGYVF